VTVAHALVWFDRSDQDTATIRLDVPGGRASIRDAVAGVTYAR
jgi:hypothetical protein